MVASHSTGNGHGLFATAANGISAVYGDCGYGKCSYAGYFFGPVHVTGYLTKAGGGFKIDHPQDPTRKYLVHSFVESPDMKNFYDGTVVLGAGGRAVVALPGYFEALNSDFRYQLTPIGEPASLFVAREVSNGSFEIAGGRPGLKVSWSVTGIRQDAFAQANRLPVEVAKAPENVGRYLNPEVFGEGEGSQELDTRKPRPFVPAALPARSAAP